MNSANEQQALKAQSAAQRLRAQLLKPGIVVCPGVYDGITARLAVRSNFDCLYMTGAGTGMSRLGMADLGMTNLSDMVANAGMIASLDRKVPLIADADTGYGGPLMVARTVREYMTAGVAALHLEDQVVAKRCGHLANKEVVDEATYLARIKAAALAREELRATTGADIVLIARTDSLQLLGYDAAVARLKRALEAGADVAFLEGMTTIGQCERVCKDLAPAPVLLNMVAGGVTPDLSAQEAADLGFKIVIFPLVALGPVCEEVEKAMQNLKRTLRADVSEIQKTGGVKHMFNVCGMAESLEFDAQAGGSAFTNGV
jgi:2-methylisocitrate lyase-like PEP mutase family enzyme